MRTRERLIEVLQTVNDTLYPMAGGALREAGACLAERRANALCQLSLEKVASVHPSPHIRELATEAWHYMAKDDQ